MAQDLPEEAREPEGALDGAVVAEGWVAVVSEWVENAYAQIVVIKQLTKEVRPVTSLIVPNAGHQWQGNYIYAYQLGPSLFYFRNTFFREVNRLRVRSKRSQTS